MLPALTDHAVARYRKRIADIPKEEILKAIDTPAFHTAMEIGAKAVILPTGHRAIIADGAIVTFSKGKAKH